MYVSTKQMLQSGHSGKCFFQALSAEGSISSPLINSL